MPSVFTTVATFDNTAEAYLHKGLLESEGIPCVVKDEHMTQIYPGKNYANGGVRLQVRQRHIYKARKILGVHGFYDH